MFILLDGCSPSKDVEWVGRTVWDGSIESGLNTVGNGTDRTVCDAWSKESKSRNLKFENSSGAQQRTSLLTLTENTCTKNKFGASVTSWKTR